MLLYLIHLAKNRLKDVRTMDAIKRKIKNILVATNFSETSDFAISRAVKFAKAAKANLTLIHVIQKEFLDKVLETVIPKDVLQTAEEYTSALILENIHALSHHKVNIDHVIISKGNPAVKILQFARRNKVANWVLTETDKDILLAA